MAVQAQYPSNALLLNRNEPDGHNYSFQQQKGFLDQSHMLFNDGDKAITPAGANVINPRKRGREGGITAQPIHPFALQSHHHHHHHHHHHQQQQHQQQQQQEEQQQPPQLIDLSQLHNQSAQSNVVSTGLRLSFGEQQQHLLQQNQQQQQQQSSFVCQSPPFLSVMSEDLATQMKRQIAELDQFLQAQGEQLRRTLAEKRRRHYGALLGVAEESINRRMREKEAEVEKATRRNAELEARAAQLSAEAQVWQAKARAQEVTAASLQAQLQQAIMCGAGPAPGSMRGNDGLGGAGGVEGQAEDAESAYVDPDRVIAVSGGPTCKSCGKRVASVVLLPCRHLCVCTACDHVVQACPLCLQVRNSGVEVFLY